jgi:pSer/pThr/pTyr-binding forkhead associated (FHA) protein
MADVPVLVCTGGALQGKRFKVPETGSLKIGRAPDNDIVIDDDGVSRVHAELMNQNGSLWLQDAGSRNGVFVNNQRVITHQQLKVGDEVSVAHHTFALRWDEPEESTADTESEPEGERRGRRRWFWPFS